MKKVHIFAVILMITAFAAPFSSWAKGPGETAHLVDNSDSDVRAFPGFHGSGTQMNGPISGTYSPDDWDEDNQDEDSGPSVTYVQGWRYNPGGWWYQYADGSWPADGWKLIDNRWYLFNSGGHMVTGWYQDLAGQWFYLNPVDDGMLGAMRTGWQIIDKKAYYFHSISDGSLGHLLMNTVTPDGYVVGPDGAMMP